MRHEVSTVYVIAVMSSLNSGVHVLCLRAVEPDLRYYTPGGLHRCAKPFHSKGSARRYTSIGRAVRACGLRVFPRLKGGPIGQSDEIDLPAQPASRTVPPPALLGA